MNPSHYHQHHPPAGRQELVLLAWRLPVWGLRCLWFLGGLYCPDPVQKSAACIRSNSVCDAVHGDDDVLLVAAVPPEPDAVGRVCGFICDRDHFECDLALSCWLRNDHSPGTTEGW